MYRILLAVFFITGVMVLQVHAEEPRFETTTKGMIKALSASETDDSGQKMQKGIVMGTRELPISGAVGGVRKPPKVNLKIEFDVNSYTIRKESFTLLDNLSSALTSPILSKKKILIKGHTDSDGADKHNLRLSLARAQAIMNYLMVNCQISPARLKARGYGEAEPLKPNISSINKQINRRVEVQIDK